MIEFNTQLDIIIFSYIYGLLFYYLLYLCRDYINHKTLFFRTINTISFFLFFSLVYFIGLEIVCDGILHIYSLFIVIFVGYTMHFIAKKKK